MLRQRVTILFAPVRAHIAQLAWLCSTRSKSSSNKGTTNAAPSLRKQLREAAHRKHPESTLAALQQIERTGRPPRLHEYDTALDAFTNGAPENAEALLQRMQRTGGSNVLTSQRLHKLLKAYVSATDAEGAERTLSRIHEVEMSGNIIEYNMLLDCYANAGDTHKAWALFQQLDSSEKRLKPRQVTYCSLVKAHANNEDAEGVMKVLSLMKERNIEPNVVAQTMAASTLAANGRSEEAGARLAAMEASRSVKPTSKTYSSVIWSFGRAKMPEKAHETFVRALRVLHEPDMGVYLVTIETLCWNRNLQAAMSIAGDMLRWKAPYCSWKGYQCVDMHEVSRMSAPVALVVAMYQLQIHLMGVITGGGSRGISKRKPSLQDTVKRCATSLGCSVRVPQRNQGIVIVENIQSKVTEKYSMDYACRVAYQSAREANATHKGEEAGYENEIE